MFYFIDYKDRNTDQKYAFQYQTPDIFEAIKIATKVAKQFNEHYNEHYKNNFDGNWSETRKEKFYKLNSWAVRVKDDDGKTVLLINSDRLRG